MKLEIKFNYLDTDNEVVRPYKVHPLYDEVRCTFGSYLGAFKSKTIKKYVDYTSFGEFEVLCYAL